MKFKAPAKTPGRCAYADCMNKAQKIYEDDKYRILACSQAHADKAREEINKIPPDVQKELWPSKNNTCKVD